MKNILSNIQISVSVYALMSDATYGNKPIEGWNIICTNGGFDGMQAVVYGKDTDGDKLYDQIVFAYRGTDSLRDIYDDSYFLSQEIPPQYNAALSFFNDVLKRPDISLTANITITGHSLGGALAQLIAAKYNLSKTNILPFFINKNLKIITDSDITDFYNFCISRGLSPRRTKNTLALLKQLLMYCKNRGWIKTCCNFQVKWLTSKNEFSMNRIIFEGD